MSSYGRIKGARAAILPPAHQADAVLNQAGPTSTQLYTVLPTTSNVRIIAAGAVVTWTVGPNPLELVITIDGQTIIYTQVAPVSGTFYAMVQVVPSYNEAGQLLAVANTSQAFVLEGRSVRIQARTTGGTVQNLSARVKWARW